jgi:hypothetical protein
MSLVATGDESNWQQGLNPLLAKNGDNPVVSEAWLFTPNSASGSYSAQSSCR